VGDGVSWLDRISGLVCAEPGHPPLPGQWEYVGERSLVGQDVSVRSHDVLTPLADGRVAVDELGVVRFDGRLVPDPDENRSLRAVGERVQQLTGEPWREWVTTPPLIPALGDELDDKPFESMLREKFGFVEAACLRPRTRLTSDDERLPVGRCKRPAKRAPEVLASRSEDWAQRTLWGIQPNRVLSVVRDELYDFYENRIVVQLVDCVELSIVSRLRAVRRLVELLRSKESYQDLLEKSANYRRAQRVLDLWTESLGDSGQLEVAEALLRRLKALHRRICATKDSVLYQRIGKRRSGALQLRMTNLLSHDEVYRRVADVWMAWEVENRLQALSPEVLWEHGQEAAQAFRIFSVLVTIRALKALGFEPSGSIEDIPIAEGVELELVGPTGILKFRWQASSLRLLTDESGDILKIVTVPAKFVGGATAGEWLKSLPDDDHLLVVGLPPDVRASADPVAQRLRSLRNLGESAGPTFTTIAPWDLESVERMARAIRWRVWSHTYRRYPRNHSAERGWSPPDGGPDWLRINDEGLALVAPPRRDDGTWAGLTDRMCKLELQTTEIEAEIEALHPHSRKRGHLKAALAEVEDELAADRRVAEWLASAHEDIAALMNCPVCHTTTTAYGFEERQDAFVCECSECGSRWGLQHCASCACRFPFLSFPGNRVDEPAADVDRQFGCDVLAVPSSADSFVCPECGSGSIAEAKDRPSSRAEL
jgi:hypothetical protein